MTGRVKIGSVWRRLLTTYIGARAGQLIRVVGYNGPDTFFYNLNTGEKHRWADTPCSSQWRYANEPAHNYELNPMGP